MTNSEWAEKMAHIRATDQALQRSRNEHAKCPTYNTAVEMQTNEGRLRELRGTFPKLRLVTA